MQRCAGDVSLNVEFDAQKRRRCAETLVTKETGIRATVHAREIFLAAKLRCILLRRIYAVIVASMQLSVKNMFGIFDAYRNRVYSSFVLYLTRNAERGRR